jgi:hypothetical protein
MPVRIRGGAQDATTHDALYLPAMGKPSYDHETLAGYFQPLDPAFLDDPIVGPTLRRLAVEDPDVIAAVADVDRSQIRDAMKQTSWERLLYAVAAWRGLSQWRRPG